MRHLKAIAAKYLLLAVELTVAFLVLDLLWELLFYKPPFSFGAYLFSGALVAAANYFFLQKRRLLWQILLLNCLLCAVWVPALSLTLDRSIPALLVFQLSLYLVPLWRGYHWGVTPVTIRLMRVYRGYMIGCSFLYLILVSYAPQFLPNVPLLLGLLGLTLAASVGMRTSGRNTVRAGAASLRHLSAFLLPLALVGAAAAVCALLLAFQGQLLLLLRQAWALLEQGVRSFFLLLSSLLRSNAAGDLGMSSGGWEEDFDDIELPEPADIDPQLVRIVLVVLLAALVIGLLAALVYWLWKNRNRAKALGEDEDDAFTRSSLRRIGLLARLRRFLRVRSFRLRYAGTPRAALLELERWGTLHRCRRQSWETPREYLERLAGGPLQGLLAQEQEALYRVLIEDVDRSIYGGLAPRLPRRQVRSLLSAIRRARRRPPAPAAPA